MDSAPRIITLGTAGGPRWRSPGDGRRRQGNATTLDGVSGAVYLVDCGRGPTTQLADAGDRDQGIRDIFITHLHSDHTVELVGLLLFCWMHGTEVGGRGDVPHRVIAPGDRRQLHPLNANPSAAVASLFPKPPTAGTRAMVLSPHLAHSTDLTDRMIDALHPWPLDLIRAEDISLPSGCGFDPNTSWCPPLAPFTVYFDELVTVAGTLVQHAPMAHVIAVRFDAEEGSVAISGDTVPNDNLVRLAEGTDPLLYEAIGMEWAAGSYTEVNEDTRTATIGNHRKVHSTPCPAGEIAAAAGARKLALHHVVPVHADPAVWRRAAETFSGPLLVPEDFESGSFACVHTDPPTSTNSRDLRDARHGRVQLARRLGGRPDQGPGEIPRDRGRPDARAARPVHHPLSSAVRPTPQSRRDPGARHGGPQPNRPSEAPGSAVTPAS